MESALCEGCPFNGQPSVKMITADTRKGGILLLGGFPDARTATGKDRVAFSSRKTYLVRSIVQKQLQVLSPAQKPDVFFSYVCLCNPVWNNEKRRYDFPVSVLTRCGAHAKDFIDLQQPDAIVAMGLDVYKVLGIKGSVPSKRGRVVYFIDKTGRKVPVVCTFDLSTVLKDHGLVRVFSNDIHKAIKLYTGAITRVENQVVCPCTADEILSRLDGLYKGIESIRGDHIDIAWDTETTSLKPHVKEDRIIVMSFSWSSHKGLAFPYQHRKAPFTEEQQQEIKAAVERVLTHPKVRLITANGNFDMRWLWARGIACKDHYWDVILAEHVLDEAKQGEYSLKDITRDRFPEYANYEEELHQHLTAAWQAKRDKVKELQEKAKEATSAGMLEWWVSLETSERLNLMSKWMQAKYIVMSDTTGLADVKKVKRKGEMVIPKKYHDSLLRMLKKIPSEELPADVQVKAEIPEELTHETFEDADLDTLLYYAAMDVITTKLIYLEQAREMREDAVQVADLRATKGASYAMIKPVGWAFRYITMPLSVELARMQLHGIRFDRDKAREYQEILNDSTQEVLEKMRMEIGVSFNPNSSADLVRILYEDLGLPKIAFTDSGVPAVDADTLKNLFDKHPDVGFLDNLLHYRAMSKIGGTYLKNWLKLSEYDGCIHADFLQTGTATFRLSSSNPFCWWGL